MDFAGSALSSLLADALGEQRSAPAQNRRPTRKGHRQQVRWGRDNLTISLVDQERFNFADFESYRVLHAEVAGRVTRNEASWGAMRESIASGVGRLVLSYLEGRLVGGTLIFDSMNTAFYASGAYRRELFDKPLSHYPVYTAMISSAAAGNRWFDLGLRPD